MKVVRYLQGTVVSHGILEAETISPISGDIFGSHIIEDKKVSLSDVSLLAPIVPGKIIGMGINYHDFCKVMGLSEPSTPYIFLKAPTSVIAPGESVVIPHPDHIVNFEAELAVVIGNISKNVAAKDALKNIFGYTIANDMTNRTDLLRDNHMGVAKNYDAFLPLGPAIETQYDWQNKRISMELNGVIKIDGNTNDMIFKLSEQISFISSIMTLYPGDVILTGCPAGATSIKVGDTMKIYIEGLGTLCNPVT